MQWSEKQKSAGVDGIPPEALKAVYSVNHLEANGTLQNTIKVQWHYQKPV